jgi:uncharacterized alkaline shock family protein YloU
MRNPDTTTIAPDVLHSIARLTALKVPGVHATSQRRLGRGSDEGVQVHVEDGIVDVDLFLIMDSDVNLRQVSHNVQAAVARAISEMLGMMAGQVNIHIEDIYYPALT